MLIQDIKKQIDQTRKAGDKELLAILTTFFSEAVMVGKNKANRESTDDEVVAVARKFINNADESLKYLQVSDPRHSKFEYEKSVLVNFIPKMVDENTVKEFVSATIVSGEKNVGKIMGALKAKFGTSVDMKLANQIVKSFF